MIKDIKSSHIIFLAASTIFIAATFFIIWKINEQFLVTVPDKGGSFTEGVIGSPRFINPVLAFSDADKDLTKLVYAGLMKNTSNNSLVPELAEEVSISDDGRVYTFTIKDNIYFHDETPITAEDVVFTIEKIQDPLIRSPKQANWNGVEVSALDDKTVQFVLPQAFAPFLENTTVGILPVHIWRNVSAEQFSYNIHNVEPVGSGPYKIDKVERNSSGLPTSYNLEAYKQYVLGEPYISRLEIRLFEDQESLIDAYEKGSLDNIYNVANGKADDILRRSSKLITSPLPRVFGIFFNPDIEPLFLNESVRKALDKSVNKERIVQEIFGGHATTLEGPLPPSTQEAEIDISYNPEEARTILEKNGWARNEGTGIWEKETDSGTQTLQFSISTSNTPELAASAELAQQDWRSFGADVELKIFDVGDLNQQVIRPREYDSLLFGTSVGRQVDLYSFWHSSGRSDPGLNIALYTNIETDDILEELRATIDLNQRQELYESFSEIIRDDTPAVFLFSPDFTYITTSKIKENEIGIINTPAERFADIHNWYIEINKVWNIFIKN